MCLANTKFALQTEYYNKVPFIHEVPVGIGYKLITKIDYGDGFVKTPQPELNKWLQASYIKSGINPPLSIETDVGNHYWPGFHIWLEPEHAEQYLTQYGRMLRQGGAFVYKVEYRHVIAFGQNECLYDDMGNMMTQEDCVIAHEMKFVEVVKNIPESYIPARF